MSEVLKQPYTLNERANFIIAHQGINNQRIELVFNDKNEEISVFALMPNEILIGEGEETTVEIDENRPKELRHQEIQHLTCTKRVFALMLQELGISYSQLKELINSNEQAQLEWELCVELLRSNPMLDLMANKLKITSEQLDKLFLYANKEITIEEFKS